MFKTLLITILISISSFAIAGNNWMVTEEGCKVWNPSPESGETALWDGECENGTAQGHGTVKWFKNGIAGNEVEGDYVDGVHKGIAIVRYPNGGVYEGFLAPMGGTRHGAGVLTLPNGKVESGIWNNGKLISQDQSSGQSVWERFGNWGKAYQEYDKQNRGTNCTSNKQNGTVYTHCN